MNTAAFTAYREKVVSNCARVIVGKEDATEKILVSFLCGGHVLLEDKPGTGKTMFLRAFAHTVGGDFKRVQFTPDLLPSDLTGINFYNQKSGEFEFRPGPLFTNFVLADEINRATPRTQSALLEAMEERQITVDGVTSRLAEPFMVLATQNPLESFGTFPLPDAQMDRFFMRLSLGYMTREQELEVLSRITQEEIPSIHAMLDQCAIRVVPSTGDRGFFINVTGCRPSSLPRRPHTSARLTGRSGSPRRSSTTLWTSWKPPAHRAALSAVCLPVVRWRSIRLRRRMPPCRAGNTSSQRTSKGWPRRCFLTAFLWAAV